jgi:glycosyltransferase involved in cell wall biosynthesis
MQKIRIAVLGTRGFPGVQGGVETHCENLYARLVKYDCDINVFTRKPYTGLKERSYNGIALRPLWCPRNKFFEAFIHTFIGVFAAKRIAPDILHIHAIGPSMFTPLARLLGMKQTQKVGDYRKVSITNSRSAGLNFCQ